MATLHVRNVPDVLYEALRARAEQEGRSIGGQTVALLEEGLGAKEREAKAVRRRCRRLPRRDLTPGERLGPAARRVLASAQQEARDLGHGYLGTEHLLLGLLREVEGPVSRVLEGQRVGLRAVRARIADEIGKGGTVPPGPQPFTPRAKKALELSLREALDAGEDLMEPQHILLGVAREGEGVAAKILCDHGADLATLRGLVGYATTHFQAQSDVSWGPGGWEYRVVALEGTPEDWTARLNDLAADGWHLESVQPDRAVFRRPRA